MLVPLLCWVEICLLLLRGACQLEEPEIGEWSTLFLHKINSGAAPAFPGKQRDSDAVLTEKILTRN